MITAKEITKWCPFPVLAIQDGYVTWCNDVATFLFNTPQQLLSLSSLIGAKNALAFRKACETGTAWSKNVKLDHGQMTASVLRLDNEFLLVLQSFDVPDAQDLSIQNVLANAGALMTEPLSSLYLALDTAKTVTDPAQRSDALANATRNYYELLRQSLNQMALTHSFATATTLVHFVDFLQTIVAETNHHVSFLNQSVNLHTSLTDCLVTIEFQPMRQLILLLLSEALKDLPEQQTLDIRLWATDTQVSLLVPQPSGNLSLDPILKAQCFAPLDQTNAVDQWIHLQVCQTILARHGSMLLRDNGKDGNGSVIFSLTIDTSENVPNETMETGALSPYKTYLSNVLPKSCYAE